MRLISRCHRPGPSWSRAKPSTSAPRSAAIVSGHRSGAPAGALARAELVSLRAHWRAEGKRVVFTNGCYDLLHRGHVRFLEQARSMGGILVLGLNSDASVRRMKGPSRPLCCEEDRAAVALALEAVDAVTLFDEDTPRELIAALQPDVLVKGADWSHFIAGREEVEASGGLVTTIPLEAGFSTTNLVELILGRARV